MSSEQPVELDPGSVLIRYRARVRQHLVASAHREADLLEEVANLEAYAAQLQAPTTDPDTNT